MDGVNDESDSESTNHEDSEGLSATNIDSEFSADDFKGSDRHAKGKCNICGEDVKYSMIYHFAVSHFKPRLQVEIQEKRPFTCPICKEELKSRMNLMSHYLGVHKKYDEWLLEIRGDDKPDWFDPNPPKGRRSYNQVVGVMHVAGVSSSPRATPVKPVNPYQVFYKHALLFYR